jgi:hypothetical protein
MILSRADYLASIESLLPDNSQQQISPLRLRTSLMNLVDSVPHFLIGSEIDTLNFSTPDTRTTRAGDMSLNGMFLAGRSSVDNSAFGYSSLKSNYNGFFNTAVGSYALSCNLYGMSNTAVGYQALVGNVTGSGNVGLGSYTFHNNKHGSYNIAIGHGAGWYVGPNANYTFILASLPIASGEFCDDDNPVYSGEPPLLYGDLKYGQHKLAIGTNQLHNFGALQVYGDASPSLPSQFHLGRTQYPWLSINQVINFSGGSVGVGGPPVGGKRLSVYGDMLVSGNLLVNDVVYNNISQCLYECKTLHLATSGFCDPEGNGFHNDAVCGYLNDQGLDGAGFEIHSSGTDYRRDYRFVYRPPGSNEICLPVTNAFTKSRWESNISLELLDGASLLSDRVIGKNQAGLVLQSGCMGVFITPFAPYKQRVVVAQKSQLNNNYPTLQDVNFIGNSGQNHVTMLGTASSGVKIVHRFASRIASESTIRGFSFVYHDESDAPTFGCDGSEFGNGGNGGGGGGDELSDCCDKSLYFCFNNDSQLLPLDGGEYTWDVSSCCGVPATLRIVLLCSSSNNSPALFYEYNDGGHPVTGVENLDMFCDDDSPLYVTLQNTPCFLQILVSKIQFPCDGCGSPPSDNCPDPFPPFDAILGACCKDGECLGVMTQARCECLGGTKWHEGKTCDSGWSEDPDNVPPEGCVVPEGAKICDTITWIDCGPGDGGGGGGDDPPTPDPF